MSNLIEEISLRNKLYIFKDRKEAGSLLTEKLIKFKGTDSIIFGIPSGGVPIASEISEALNLPMDLIIVRKIQIPYNPEAGFGAMGPDGEVIFNERLLNQLGLTKDEINNQVKKTQDIIKQRNRLFRQARPYPPMKDKYVIVVDDGLASGYTMLTAVKFIKRKGTKRVIVAVPTGSEKTAKFLLKEADEIVCLNLRAGVPFAVADAYKIWYDLSDEEVLDILRKRC